MAIVIIVENGTKVSILCAKNLRFEKILKIVEKYWEVGPSLICINCARVGHNHLEKYRDKDL